MGKKILIAFIALTLVVASLAWICIPDQPQVSGKIFVRFPGAPLQRGFLSADKLDEYFPGETLAKNTFKINDRIYKIIGTNVSSINIESYVENQLEQKWISNIAVYHTSDSTFFIYKGAQAIPTSNLFTKLSSWITMKNQIKEMKMICDAATNYFNTIEHIYGFNIIENTMPDLTMITTKIITVDTPDIENVYNLIGTLRDAVNKTTAKSIDSPMLNITRITEKEIMTMVALPISKDIPTHGNIQIKKMILGNKLETTVKGDEKQLKAALQAMHYYIEDQSKTSPAIPYQILLNNRLTTPDSLWITKINFPIF